jgi:hypothetical protein
MSQLLAALLPRFRYPHPIHFKEKRAITLAEHQRIVAAEVNPERKNLYQLCWLSLAKTPSGSKMLGP